VIGALTTAGERTRVPPVTRLVSNAVAPRSFDGPTAFPGNRAMQRELLSRIRPKLSAPHDHSEQEADRVADAVLASSPVADGTPVTRRRTDEVLHRCSGGCGPTPCDHRDEQEASVIQPLQAPGAAVPTQVPRDMVPMGGRPLAGEVRSFFEPRFGTDFSAVRVHTGPDAARAASSIDALAYTVGSNIVFGTNRYAPTSEPGKWILAHELTHVMQQDGNHDASPHTNPSHLRVNRLVRTANVTWPAAVTPGVANPNPHGSDRRASTLLTSAIDRIIRARAARPANAADPDVIAVGNALRTAFRLNPTSDDTWNLGAPQVRLPVIQRRLEIARTYIDSVVFTVDCVAAGGAHVIPGCAAGACTPGTEAFTCHGNARDIVLCPLFWARSLNQRGRIWIHEFFHVNFGFINDWGQPDRQNAHCYAQFVALLNGFNSPAGYRCH